MIRHLVNPRYRWHPHGGFTLIEVLVVIVILALMANLAVPMFGSTQTQQLLGAMQILEADLHFTRVDSIAHPDAPRVFVIDTQQGGYYIAQASDTATPITNPITKQPYVVRFGQGRAAMLNGVVLTTHQFDDDNELQFGPFGQLDQTTAATLTLATDTQTLTVSIDPTSGETAVGALQSP